MIVCQTTDTHYGWNHKTENHHRKRLREIKREMEKLGCTTLLHTGDWVMSRQRQLKRIWNIFREVLGPEITIVCVLGNHDFWHDEDDLEVESWDQLFQFHRDWALENDIHYLSEFGPLAVEDVCFIGFDG